MRPLQTAKDKARELERQLEEAKNSGGNNTWAIIVAVNAVIALILVLALW